MTQLKWSNDLNTGIDVIDRQHQRIVEYINELHLARASGHAKDEIGRVLDELIEYTLSHFSFEESLQDESGYPFSSAHKKVHDQFSKRIGDFRRRFLTGEDVTTELSNLLNTWLLNHIKCDDSDYVSVVKSNLHQKQSHIRQKAGNGMLARLFG